MVWIDGLRPRSVAQPDRGRAGKIVPGVPVAFMGARAIVSLPWPADARFSGSWFDTAVQSIVA
jgi:hypothetical protein